MQPIDRQFINHPRPRVIAAVLAAVLSLVLGNVPLNAQTQAFTATLSGTVTDSSGAVVPKATVKLTSVERGIVRTFNTGDSGNFSFQLLPPADYDLKVEMSGFQSYEQRGISLAAPPSASNARVTAASNREPAEVTHREPAT